MSRQSRGISGLGSPDTPRKLESLQEPFLAVAELCQQIVRALRRDLIPNGEAMLADQLTAAATRNTNSVDQLAIVGAVQLIACRDAARPQQMAAHRAECRRDQ